jgi:polyphosphate kinase 2 (PPK2 family)
LYASAPRALLIPDRNRSCDSRRHAQIDRLQEVLYAQAKYALLVVLQGLDTSGKDGTIRRVFSPLNPLGAVATSLKMPTPRELAHDFYGVSIRLCRRRV